MAKATVEEKVRHYLTLLPEHGINARRAVLYGSHARGTANEWSDIDLIIVAPEFDKDPEQALERELWIALRDTDAPIEPIACGEKQWETDDETPILEVARLEGIEITL